MFEISPVASPSVNDGSCEVEMRCFEAVFCRNDPVEVSRVEATLMAHVPFPDVEAVSSERWVSLDHRIVLVAASNEPVESTALIQTAHGGVRWTHVGQLHCVPAIDVSSRLAQVVAETPGRFSLVAIDPDCGRLVAATSPSGAEPLFVSQRDGVTVVSSWAGVASALAEEVVGFDRVAVCSMINNGFMATRQTPYPGVPSLTPGSAFVVDDQGCTVHDHWQL